MTQQNPPRVRPSLLIFLVLVLAMAAFYKFGRPIWKPIQVKLFGGRTIESVLAQHKVQVSQRFPQWTQLTDGQQLTLLAFKQERMMELWKSQQGKLQYVKSYRFTGFSGALGPKLKEGDGQIPEGVYELAYLNPNSSYHLSMKVSYPNAFDREMGKRDKREKLGDDIFIHGKNATIGCIPIGDEPIEELFSIIASNRQHKDHVRTKVIIAPYDMRTKTKSLTIPGITWEGELYKAIGEALKPYHRNQHKGTKTQQK